MSEDAEDESTDEFQDWWQSPRVQKEIRSIQTLTGSSMAEAALIVMMAQVAAQLDVLAEKLHG